MTRTLPCEFVINLLSRDALVLGKMAIALVPGKYKSSRTSKASTRTSKHKCPLASSSPEPEPKPKPIAHKYQINQEDVTPHNCHEFGYESASSSTRSRASTSSARTVHFALHDDYSALSQNPGEIKLVMDFSLPAGFKI